MAEALIFLIALFISIALPIWTYIDAEDNSDHSPILWALVVFFGGLVGLLLYFILGRS